MPEPDNSAFIITDLKFLTMNGCCPGKFAIQRLWPARQVKSYGTVRQNQTELKNRRANATGAGTPGLAPQHVEPLKSFGASTRSVEKCVKIGSWRVTSFCLRNTSSKLHSRVTWLDVFSVKNLHSRNGRSW